MYSSKSSTISKLAFSFGCNWLSALISEELDDLDELAELELDEPPDTELSDV